MNQGAPSAAHAQNVTFDRDCVAARECHRFHFAAHNIGNAAGNFIQKLICRALGSNVGSVLRVYANNGGVNSTAANNALVAEVTLPTTTLSQTAAMAGVEIPLNLVLPQAYNLNATLGTAVAAGWMVTAIGGQY